MPGTTAVGDALSSAAPPQQRTRALSWPLLPLEPLTHSYVQTEDRSEQCMRAVASTWQVAAACAAGGRSGLDWTGRTDARGLARSVPCCCRLRAARLIAVAWSCRSTHDGAAGAISSGTGKAIEPPPRYAPWGDRYGPTAPLAVACPSCSTACLCRRTSTSR